MYSIASISAIDVHGHYGAYVQLDKSDLYNRMMTGDAAEVVRRAASGQRRPDDRFAATGTAATVSSQRSRRE